MSYLIPGNAWHIGSREQQQDSFGFSNMEDRAFRQHGGMVAIVADGMGGMVQGQAASIIAKDAFLRAYALKAPAETIPEALVRCLHVANHEVVDKAKSQGLLGRMGTTLIAVVCVDDGIYMISVGDSSAFLLRSQEIMRLNRLHTRGDELDRQARRGTLPPDEARQDPDRHALTSFLGLEKLERFDVTRRPHPIPGHPGDHLVICSDGLSNALTEEQILERVVGPPQKAAEALVQHAIDRRLPNQDNVTVLVIARTDGGE